VNEGVDRQLSRRAFLGGAARTAVAGGSVAALVAACGGSSAATGAGSSSSSLAMGLFAEPDSLDPATMRLIPSYQVATAIYDQLLWKLSGGGPNDFLPGLASSYQVSPDGRAYTFKLRQGATFHDGTPVDAQAVKTTFDRIVDPATKSISAKSVLGPYAGTTVVDASTVRITFGSPNGGFLDNVASPLLAIVSPTAATKYGASFGHHPVGSGPFMFKSWTSGQSIQLARNPKYQWGPAQDGLRGPAKLSNVTYQIVVSSPAQANALQTGALQMAQGMAIPDVVRLTKAGFRKMIIRASGMPFGFMLNVQKAPTDELAVRQAVQYATNPAAINRTVFSDVYPSANTVLTAATFGHDATVSYAYDPSRAASLLEAAGWKTGSGGIRQKDGKALSLSWLLSTGFGFQDAAQLMASQLQAVGIKSSITQQAAPEVFANIEAGVMNVSSIYDYAADPYVLNTLFSCAQVGKGPNYSHFCSPSVDSAIAAANATASAAERAMAYGAIQRRLMQQAMFVPIYDTSAVFVSSTSVRGLAFTPLAIPLLTGASA
jgi:peptide/nickel transport system substrate-binding protein